MPSATPPTAKEVKQRTKEMAKLLRKGEATLKQSKALQAKARHLSKRAAAPSTTGRGGIGGAGRFPLPKPGSRLKKIF